MAYDTLSLDFENDSQPIAGGLPSRPTPAADPRTPRSYYRCADCLSVVATAGRFPQLQCSACNGAMEHMGDVAPKGRLTIVQQRCPCDGRCTGALGPLCDCKCGGRNHGSGLLVDVIVDAGPVPIARLHDTIIAKRRAAEYRQALAEALGAVNATFGRVFELKRLGQYLGHTDFSDYCRGADWKRRIAQACTLRTHSGRIEKLRAIAKNFEKG